MRWEHAINITLSGEYACSSARREQCITVTTWTPEIYNVTELAITNLRLVSSSQLTLTLTQIHNLTIKGVVVEGELKINQPKGSVFISRLTVDQFVMDITFISMSHSAECAFPPLMNTFDTCKQLWINVTIFNSTLQTTQIATTSRRMLCSNSSYVAAVHFDHCVFRDRVHDFSSLLVLIFSTDILRSKVTIVNCDFIHCKKCGYAINIHFLLPYLHTIEVKNTHFSGNIVQYSIIQVSNMGQLSYFSIEEPLQFIPSIIIDNCTFTNNSIGESVINNEERSLRRQERPLFFEDFATHFTFYGHNIFTDNKLAENTNWRNFPFVLALDNALVEIAGVVEVENNQIDVAAVVLLAKSKILLHNNSLLRIANNGNSSTNIQLLVYYTLDYFQQFLDVCNVKGCDGMCLFQFVDNNGRYIAEDDLEYFDASIILSNGVAREKIIGGTQPHYLINNANLQNCTLTLKERNLTLEEDEKKKRLKFESWDETAIGSPAYYACTCDPTRPEDRKLWDCSSGNVTTTVYPGLSVTVGLVALGDYGFVQKANFTILSTPETSQVFSIIDTNRLFCILSNYYLTVIWICICFITLSDGNSKHCLFLSILER